MRILWIDSGMTESHDRTVSRISVVWEKFAVRELKVGQLQQSTRRDFLFKRN